MRQTIASTWVYQLVIIFILLFVSFLTLSLTYSKAFKNKNELLNIIEKYEGITQESIAIMNNYLVSNGYKAMKSCPSNDGLPWYGISDIHGKNISFREAVPGEKYYYCVRRQKSSASNNKVYYELKLFFRFNLPVVENIGTFTVDGSTSDVFESCDLIYQNVNKNGRSKCGN